MLLGLTARDLLLVSFEVDPDAVAGRLPAGLRPALLESGAALLSVVALRSVDVRLGARHVPSYSQVTVRTYVARAEEGAVFFLSLRVTLPGLAGALFGVPVRPARIRVRDGAVAAPALGVSFRYRRLGAARAVPHLSTGAVGTGETAYLVSAGLRRLRAEHEPFAWEEAELLEPPRYDPVLALGFDVAEPCSVLAARATRFRVELRPRPVSG